MRILIVLASVCLPFAFAFDTHRAAHQDRGACPFAHRTARNSEKRGNAFDPSQLVDVTGEHAYRPPKKGDLRGPCPGLNALANHGYLDRSGLTNLIEAAIATNTVYNMGIDLGTFLSADAFVFSGDPLSLDFQWSIGGPPSGIHSGIFGPPKGLSGTHNKFEGDASPTRMDAYLNRGDATTLNIDQFLQLYNLDPEHKNYDKTTVLSFRSERFDHSVQNNPHFFYGPLSGLIEDHAAYFFIYELMSNHTENGPVLNGDVLRSFFGVSADFTPLRGQERIPDNWYRRSTPYTILDFEFALTELLRKNPKYIAVGGNTGTVNSFTPFNLANLTGGVFNTKNLSEGNNLQCFMYQALMAVTPNSLEGGVVGAFRTCLLEHVAPIFAHLDCPELQKWDTSVFGIYPGADDSY